MPILTQNGPCASPVCTCERWFVDLLKQHKQKVRQSQHTLSGFSCACHHVFMVQPHGDSETLAGITFIEYCYFIYLK